MGAAPAGAVFSINSDSLDLSVSRTHVRSHPACSPVSTRFVFNVLGGLAMPGGIALKVANYYVWKNPLYSLMSSLVMGGSLGELMAFNLPASVYDALGEFLMFSAPVYFQALTQGELNLPNTPPYVEGIFSALQIHFGALLFMQMYNLLTAEPEAFEGGAKTFHPMIEGDNRKFRHVFLSQLPTLITGIVLLALGIWKEKPLWVILGTYFTTRAGGAIATQPFLDWILKVRDKFNRSIQEAATHPASMGVRATIVAYKLLPIIMALVLGMLPAWGNVPNFFALGTITGVGREIKSKIFQEEAPTNALEVFRSHHWRSNIVEKMTPLPGYLVHSDRAFTPASRKVMDVSKGVFAMLALGGILTWSFYWITQYSDWGDWSQLMVAATTAWLTYFAICHVYALCTPGHDALKNTVLFQMENLEDWGSVYLILFDSYLFKGETIASAIPMWVCWSVMLMTPLVIMSKKGKPLIVVLCLIYLYWQVYIATKYAKGELIG